ncbi:hypothetical protein J2X61_003718 [Bacillus sp. 3255]|nr:hypothetical protein [Bacillus sp. 3255]
MTNKALNFQEEGKGFSYCMDSKKFTDVPKNIPFSLNPRVIIIKNEKKYVCEGDV